MDTKSTAIDRQFEVTLTEMQAPPGKKLITFSQRTVLVTCETFAQAEKMASDMKESFETITEISMEDN
jgi:hypothetical protein